MTDNWQRKLAQAAAAVEMCRLHTPTAQKPNLANMLRTLEEAIRLTGELAGMFAPSITQEKTYSVFAQALETLIDARDTFHQVSGYNIDRSLETAALALSSGKLAAAERSSHPRAFTIWRFDDAPPAYQALSMHGGDEDWVVYVPAEMSDDFPCWMDGGGSFGSGSVSRHKLPDGAEVRIGAH